VIHRIHAIRRDVHLEERPMRAEIENAFDRNPAQRQIVRQLPIGDRDARNIFANPIRQYLHANCSRNRRSPE